MLLVAAASWAIWPSRALADDAAVLLAAADACGMPALAPALRSTLAAHRLRPLGECVVRGAAARVRAMQALKRARGLFLHTDFAGCASLLAIAERELSANLSGATAALTARAHGVLAEVNLWLGVCQWIVGQKETAAAAFQRSARLPSSPVPDAGELPPAVVRAYREAVQASGPRRVCADEISGEGGQSLLVNGRIEQLTGPLELAEGGHYLAWGGCVAGQPGCSDASRYARACAGSQRIEVSDQGCRVATTPPPRDTAVCLGREEAADAGFGAAVVQQADAAVYVVVESRGPDFRVRLLRRGDTAFVREVSGKRAADNGAEHLLEQALSAALVIGSNDALRIGRPTTTPFYKTWWFWGIAGAVVGAATTLTVVSLAN